MLGRLSNVLASIDGGESTTDAYRGRGIYRQVIKNLKQVRDRIGGSVTARVTWGNPDTCFEELDQLVRMGMVRNKLFPHRAQELYAGRAQCRVSTHLLNVMPNGEIYPCPDLLYAPAMKMGDVKTNWLKKSPLQLSAAMPCEGCEAYPWCRGNCMKNMYIAYVSQDARYRSNVVEPICELIRFMGREIDKRKPQAWFEQATLPVRKQLTECEIYEYVEVMP
jgi:radical SAM protein with 4Fe4S-binding SPASM domain